MILKDSQDLKIFLEFSKVLDDAWARRQRFSYLLVKTPSEKTPASR